MWAAREDVAQGLLGSPERVRVGPQVELRADRRHLDRDVVDVGARHEREHVGSPTRRLGVPEHGLAQQVDVDPEPLGAQARQVPAQGRVGGVRQQVPDQGPEAATGQRHDGTREGRGEAGRPSAGGCGRPGRGSGAAPPPPVAAAGGRPRRATRGAARGRRRPWRRRASPDRPSARGAAWPGRVRPGSACRTPASDGPGRRRGRPGSRPGHPPSDALRGLRGVRLPSPQPSTPGFIPRFHRSLMFPGERGCNADTRWVGPQRRSHASSPGDREKHRGCRVSGGMVLAEKLAHLVRRANRSGVGRGAASAVARARRFAPACLASAVAGCGVSARSWPERSSSSCSAEASCSASGERP